MIKRQVTPEEVVELLNDLVQKDQAMIASLFGNRVPCNEAITKHPTVQVMRLKDDKNIWAVGILGILNGLFGANKHYYGCIVAEFDKGCINKFIVNYEGKNKDA